MISRGRALLPLFALLAIPPGCSSPTEAPGCSATQTCAADTTQTLPDGVLVADTAAPVGTDAGDLSDPDPGPAAEDTGPATPDDGPVVVADATEAEDVAPEVATSEDVAQDVGEELPTCALGPFPETLAPGTVPQLAQAAYQLALEIPHVLACCTCYCGCPMSRGHTSLLDCYTDDHAVG